ncbi:D-inositol 3-phosphate glycosyltransferase [compost metagenome]
MIPCDISREQYGKFIIPDLIRSERPHILLTLGDPWMTEFVPYMDERKYVYHIAYFPLDGYPVPTEWIPWLNNADFPVVFSKFAQDLVKGVTGYEPRLIYHGVNLDSFHPLENRDAIRGRLGVDDKFVVGTVARNQPRKNLPALVKAFSEFAKNKDDVLLYMHTQTVDVGWNIADLVRRFEVTDKAYTTANLNSVVGVSDDELCEIYNVFDIFVLPTMAEGFGLPILEAQACGVPVLVTDFSACTELVPDRQSLLKVKDTLIMGRNIEQAIVDIDDIKRKLDYFYYDWKRREGRDMKKLSAKSIQFSKSFAMENMGNGFIKLIRDIERELPARNTAEILPTFYRV